jgi:hypothetical protein
VLLWRWSWWWCDYSRRMWCARCLQTMLQLQLCLVQPSQVMSRADGDSPQPGCVHSLHVKQQHAGRKASRDNGPRACKAAHVYMRHSIHQVVITCCLVVCSAHSGLSQPYMHAQLACRGRVFLHACVREALSYSAAVCHHHHHQITKLSHSI